MGSRDGRGEGISLSLGGGSPEKWPVCHMPGTGPWSDLTGHQVPYDTTCPDDSRPSSGPADLSLSHYLFSPLLVAGLATTSK